MHHYATSFTGEILKDSVCTSSKIVVDPTMSGFNDCLARGSNCLNNLYLLIVNWRSWNYAFCADLHKMYNSVRIVISFRNLYVICLKGQSFWRKQPSEGVPPPSLVPIPLVMLQNKKEMQGSDVPSKPAQGSCSRLKSVPYAHFNRSKSAGDILKFRKNS